MIPDRNDALRQRLKQEIVERLTTALLDDTSLYQLTKPVLRIDAFIQEGDQHGIIDTDPNLIISVSP